MNKRITEKNCAKCEEVRPITEFYSVNRSYCNECERITARERMKRYNATPRGKAAQALNDSRKAVRKVEAETGREIKDDLTLIDVSLVLGNPQCAYCGEDIPMENRTLDHITPLKSGGDNTYSNITQACRTCNSSKSDYPALSYMHREKVVREEAALLIASIAQRERISYDDAYMKLFKDAVTYFRQQKESEADDS